MRWREPDGASYDDPAPKGTPAHPRGAVAGPERVGEENDPSPSCPMHSSSGADRGGCLRRPLVKTMQHCRACWLGSRGYSRRSRYVPAGGTAGVTTGSGGSSKMVERIGWFGARPSAKMTDVTPRICPAPMTTAGTATLLAWPIGQPGEEQKRRARDTWLTM